LGSPAFARGQKQDRQMFVCLASITTNEFTRNIDKVLKFCYNTSVMSENKHSGQEVPKESDPKNRLYSFATSLLKRLEDGAKTETIDLGGGVKAVKSFAKLGDGSEIGLTYETVLEGSADETDLITIVQRKKDAKTGKIQDFLYGIDASAIAERSLGRKVEPHRLEVILNTAALSELQITPREARDANISPEDVFVSSVLYQETHNANAEMVMAKIVNEAINLPDDAWHNNWTQAA
jgi:hypothetical protein